MRGEQQTLGGVSVELCYQIVSARDEERAANTRRRGHRIVLPDSARMRRELQTLGGGSIELCHQIVSARDEERAANTRRMEHRVVLPDSECKG